MRSHIKDFFENNAPGWGGTFAAHPVSMACGYEVMKYYYEEKIFERV